MESEGSIDGSAATVVYEQHEKGESVLKWKQTSTKEEWTTIEAASILGVEKGSSTETDTILLASANPDAKENSKKSPVVFQAVAAERLPRGFVDDFAFENPFGQWQTSSSTVEGGPHIHVIVSTGSGTGLAEEVFASLLQPLLAHFGLQPGQDYKLHTTTSPNSVTELTTQTLLPVAKTGTAQLLLLLSGDGGIVDIVNAILSPSSAPGPDYRNPTIALLPLGTGNALANSSTLTADNTFGLRSLLRGSPRRVPLFRATFSPGARVVVDEGSREEPFPGYSSSSTDETETETGIIQYGTVVCSWGLHAGLVADSDTAAYRVFGAERFKLAAREALFPSSSSEGDGMPHVYRGKVEILVNGKEEWEGITTGDEDEEEEGEGHGYVLATPVRCLEKNFDISPSSKPLDGQLYVIRYGCLSGTEAMQVMGGAYKGGQHVHDARVRYEAISGLRVQMREEDGRWRRVCLDGKIVRVEEGGWVQVQGGVEGVVDLMVL